MQQRRGNQDAGIAAFTVTNGADVLPDTQQMRDIVRAVDFLCMSVGYQQVGQILEGGEAGGGHAVVLGRLVRHQHYRQCRPIKPCH
ncbi:hypothetical protein ALO91_200050 [Pseudomonas syringae pv. aceris]|uniref:Putative type VI secretion system effector, Hcp1 family n=1 Tax=Pseudomonas syringae pv. aceris TaxID=199198 RepID=A0A0P9HQ25_PSESX|nr:hypothetical protein ALO91_200050 [Pseudomonas syringae pv. aceris]